MNKIHVFNARYEDDIYGVTALELDTYYLCVMTKYQIALIYKNGLKCIFENKLKTDEDFRDNFFKGDPVRILKNNKLEGNNHGE